LTVLNKLDKFFYYGEKILEFKEKQYDGIYEVSEVEIHNQNQIFKGMLYFPPRTFHKPYPLIIYFHGFPQLFALKEIVNDHQYLLDMGYSFLAFNFRGYRFSQGEVSITSQVSDSIKVIEFVRKMAERNIFNLNSINLLAHDFGGYIALILSSKIKDLNRMLLISPIINLEKHAYHIDFSKSLGYINQFLPGNVSGIENVDDFIKKTKNELKNKSYQIKKVLKHLNCKTLRIIIGDLDKITPVNEITEIFQNSIINLDLVIIDNMDHEIIQEEEVEKIHKEIKNFFKFKFQ